MDGLDEFENSLAAEKSAREKSLKQEKDQDRHRRHHHHRSRHHRSREDGEEREGHRHKRSRHSRNSDGETDPKKKLPLPNEEEPESSPAKQSSKRDSWMTAPSALDFDYIQKGVKKELPATNSRPDYDLKIHKNELNHRIQDLAEGKSLDEISSETAEHNVGYEFGDAGSQWRMTKLKSTYRQADESGRPIDEVAREKYGDVRDFDAAREEEVEIERHKLYGEGYIGKQKPSGELFKERTTNQSHHRDHESALDSSDSPELPQGEIMEEKHVPALDQTSLNRLKAQMLKAKFKGSPDAIRLEEEYQRATASAPSRSSTVVTLGVMENRLLAGTRGEVKAIENRRGRERGLVEENEDMSIADMVREERRTRGQAGGESQRFASRIVKDGKFDASLDYMDENAEKLAKRVQKSEINLKNTAISDYQKMNRILDNCPLCHHEDKNLPPAAPLISLATRVYLTLPTEPELSEGGAVIVPIQHRGNLLECDDDEWEEIRNFMKCLTRMYHDQGRDVVFYENAAAPQRKLHAAIQAVPLPYSLGETAPAFFKEAILASDEEWTQHKKLIDTASRSKNGLGKFAFRQTIAKEMPYFHVWFDIDGGLGHIVEDSNRWPKGDLFAREIIGGMLDLEPDVVKRQGRWTRGLDYRSEGFKKRWRKFDWTRVLGDE